MTPTAVPGRRALMTRPTGAAAGGALTAGVTVSGAAACVEAGAIAPKPKSLRYCHTAIRSPATSRGSSSPRAASDP